MSEEEKYDLNESAKGIGQLYPVLVDKKGRVIDGFHRLQADPTWRVQPLDNIDTEEKLLLARCVANWHRRTIGREEKVEWINGLAKLYIEQGLKIGKQGTKEKNEVIDKLHETLGLSERTLRVYLLAEFKQEPYEEERPSRFPASQVIKNKVGGDYGEQLVKRHREEVKEELRHDPAFILETIERAPEVLPTLPQSPVTREGYYKPILTKQEAERMHEIREKTEKEFEQRRDDPKVQERAKWVRAWQSLGNILGVIDSVFCPICGLPSSNLVWKCHPEITLKRTEEIVNKKLWSENK